MALLAVLGLALVLVPAASAQTVDPDSFLKKLLDQYQKQGTPSGRVIGGNIVGDRCKAPFNAMVALQIEFQQSPVIVCSGVMLSADLVLTTAVCIQAYNSQTAPIKVIIGEKFTLSQDQYEETVTFDSFKVHPSFNVANGEHNLALLKLPTPVTLSACVQPMQRYRRDRVTCFSAMQNCTIAGWGEFDFNAGGPPVNSVNPRYGNVRLLSEELSAQLAARNAYTRQLKPNTLYGLPYPGSAIQACVLDWGGMVACQDGNDWLLRAIISEETCYEGNNNPMVLPNIEKYQGWLDSCINDYTSAGCLSQ